MTKKILKYSIGIIGILIFIIIASRILITKNISSTKSLAVAKKLLEPAQASTSEEQVGVSEEQVSTREGQILTSEEDDGSFTYSTAGNDSANYIDGDTSGTKSEWVKNGDTWTYTFYVDDPDAQWHIWEDSSSLMEGYTGDYTEYNAGTLFTEETLNSFTPTKDMKVSTNSNGRQVYTWLDTENSYKVIDNGNGTFTKITTKLSFTITNYNIDTEDQVYYGNLTINKVVKDSEGNTLTANDDSTNFVFTITLTANDGSKAFIEGTKSFGDVIFKNGVGTVSLKAGGSITISDIPAGVSYSVTEKELDEYETSYDSNNGTIAKDSNETVTFTNTKKPEPEPGPGGEVPEEKNTSFTVAKKVTGNYEVEEDYKFEISLNNLKANTTYNLSNGTSFTSDSIGSANVSVSLKNGESVTVQDIPVGSKYKVYEHAGDCISSYVITDNNNMGLINNSANNNTKTNKDLSTSTETADEGEDIVITFTNKKIVTQNLKLVKIVTDDQTIGDGANIDAKENQTNDDEDNTNENTYTFTIEFANMEKGTSFNSSIGKITADSNGKADATIYLADGDEVEFYEVPVGTTYKITELASTSIASYTITDQNGINKIVKASGANDKAKIALSTEEETVNEGEEATVTFINDIVNQDLDSVSASLGVIKNVLNINGEQLENCKDTFTFEITPDDETNPMPENKTITTTGNGEENFGAITFTKTGTYSYKVTELAGDLDYYDYDDSVYTIVYEVTNADGLLEVTKSVKKNGFNSDVIVFINKISKSDVKISKTDEDGNLLAGATLQVLDSEGNVVKEWITGENKEDKEKDNTEENKAEIDDEKQSEATNIVEYILELKPETLKEDNVNGDERATVGICTVKLEPGTYTLHEVQAPEGYEVADDIIFTINEDGAICVNDEIVDEITMIDLKVEEKPEDPGEPEEPENPENPEEPDDSENPKDSDDNEEEKTNEPEEDDNNKEELNNPEHNKVEENEHKSLKTGDKVVIFIIVIISATGVILMIAINRKFGK